MLMVSLLLGRNLLDSNNRIYHNRSELFKVKINLIDVLLFSGISKPRLSKKGGQLPSARTISLNIHRPIYRSDSRFSVMLAVWGQFLDHDITATALNQKTDGGAISCCSNLTESSPECFPVILDRSDPFTRFNVTCMEFVRSAPSPQCCLGLLDTLRKVFVKMLVFFQNNFTQNV